MIENSIGGYFEYAFEKKYNYPYRHAYQYKSARSAFYAYLKEKKIKEIYVPHYICDSMLLPLEILNINVKWYFLDESFYPIINDYNNGYILYVNYFGLCESQVKNLRNKYPSDKVIIDNSQALYSEPKKGFAATIYSPRKFLPVPEGGSILTNEKMKYEGSSETSISALSALVKRFDGDIAGGYIDFRSASEELNKISTHKMSKFNFNLLDSFDYIEIKKIRKKMLIIYMRTYLRLICYVSLF